MAEADRATLADLRSYYEREAELKHRGRPRRNRVRARDDYIELLRAEGRERVVDFGAGPAGDVVGFVEAGIACIGVDLAFGNAKLAADQELLVVHGSIAAPPFRAASFDAGWSMSTLMHVPEAEVPDVVRAMTVPLESGAPLMIGLWGGARRDEISTTQIAGEQRLFSMRPLQMNRDLLSSAGAVEHSETWDVGPEGWHYQLFRIRVGG